MLAELIGVSFHTRCKSRCHAVCVNLNSNVCQLFLNKTGGKRENRKCWGQAIDLIR